VEPADHDVMLRPPRDPRARVIGGRMWAEIAFAGAVMAVATLGVMDWALPGGLFTSVDAAGRGLRHAQTMAFSTLVFCQLFNALAVRHEVRSAFHRFFANRWLWVAILVSATLQVAVVHAPFLQGPFRTVPLDVRDWLTCVAAASSVLWAIELRKLVLRSWVAAAPG
jgi:magnesium-transporting ATPase (P-type)